MHPGHGRNTCPECGDIRQCRCMTAGPSTNYVCDACLRKMANPAGVATGRIQAAQPNESNPPRSNEGSNTMSTHLVTFAICEMGPMGTEDPSREETHRLPIGVVFNKGDRVVINAVAYTVVSVYHNVDDKDEEEPYRMSVTLVVQPTGGPRR